jgi:hypothetical protein
MDEAPVLRVSEEKAAGGGKSNLLLSAWIYLLRNCT